MQITLLAQFNNTSHTPNNVATVVVASTTATNIPTATTPPPAHISGFANTINDISVDAASAAITDANTRAASAATATAASVTVVPCAASFATTVSSAYSTSILAVNTAYTNTASANTATVPYARVAFRAAIREGNPVVVDNVTFLDTDDRYTDDTIAVSNVTVLGNNINPTAATATSIIAATAATATTTTTSSIIAATAAAAEAAIPAHASITIGATTTTNTSIVTAWVTAPVIANTTDAADTAVVAVANAAASAVNAVFNAAAMSLPLIGESTTSSGYEVIDPIRHQVISPENFMTSSLSLLSSSFGLGMGLFVTIQEAQTPSGYCDSM